MVPANAGSSKAMQTRDQLEDAVERTLRREVKKIFATVPYADHLIAEDTQIEESYYLRHRVETVKRIRLTSKTDALALACMIDEDYKAARWWSRYIAQELSHDLLYLNDLKKHGVTERDVDAIQPFLSTTAMVDYIEGQIRTIGSLAAVAYSVCAEWNSERASAKVVANAEKRYSARHVAGAKAHVGIDEDEDHYKVMLDVSHALLKRNGSDQVFLDLLTKIMSFFGQYFGELYAATIAPPKSTAA
jgi:hypothetical protein